MRRRELMLMLGGAMTAAGASHAHQTAMSAVGYLHTSPRRTNKRWRSSVEQVP
jgi:hypothetical protein